MEGRQDERRPLLVVAPAEADDSVRDVAEVLTSSYAWLYGRRAAADGARRVAAVVTRGGLG
ncbi:hypothetical protein [Actinoplanes solisilvae]|uniref:hypothetical protein n=1 Tax=Actinoplanes solisilvae TaxID=2486853 RepID=UPI000FD7192E|nr:hypothetical protein [Actinoplanes solisilvae]